MPTNTPEAVRQTSSQEGSGPASLAPPSEGQTTRAQAERHEALWLSLTALHSDSVALGARKPAAPVSDALRIAAEGLLADCAGFTRRRKERLPVAAPDLAGLAVQLGQALAALEAWESRHTDWDMRHGCRIWNLDTGYLPIMRLNPPAAALRERRENMTELRRKLADRIDARQRYAYEQGFAAGRQARTGAPDLDPAAAAEQTYPRLRHID